MSGSRLAHSLRFRVIVGLLLPLLVAILLLSYIRQVAYRNLLIRELERTASISGELIESSLRHGMLTNDLDSVRRAIADIGYQEDVQRLFLVDKLGQVVMSTGDPPIGATIDISDATCRICHDTPVVSHNESAMLTIAPRTGVLRNVNVIENAPECQSCHAAAGPAIGVLISDFRLQPVDAALIADRRNNIVWTLAAVALILLIVDLMVNRLVIRWIEHLVGAIRRLAQGDLDVRLHATDPDEYRILANAFNGMADGLVEKERLERRLYEQADTLKQQAQDLATLHAVSTTASQSLELEKVLCSALDEVLEATRFQTGWVFLRDDQDDAFRLAATAGQARECPIAESACAWDQCEGWPVLHSGQPRAFSDAPGESCAMARCLQGKEAGVCVPLSVKERVLGVMVLIGDKSVAAGRLGQGAMEMLSAIGRQIGVAVENARLYEALHQKEERHRQLLERLITVQEDERGRIARELHDQTSQPLSSLIMTLDILETPGLSAETKEKHIQALRQVATSILEQVHALALELRPSVLDDLGLLAAFRNLFEDYEERFRLPIDFHETGIREHRLPRDVETALYRIAQEALINVARHAEARNVGVLLEDRVGSVVLMVEDDGVGFDVAATMGSRRQERNLGLYGMQERAALVGGTLTIESAPGKGTAIFVQIPLERGANHDEQDSAAAGG